MPKNFRFVFKENADMFLCAEKIENLYLMKIQISFYLEKKFRSVFNENPNQFFIPKKNFKSVFNENTDQFLFKKNSDLYLMKIRFSFYL